MLRWLARFLSDDAILDECDRRDIPRFEDPIDRLESLDDERGRIYLWKVKSEERRRAWLSALEEWRDKNGEFRAVHIVATDPEELHELNADEIDPYL